MSGSGFRYLSHVLDEKLPVYGNPSALLQIRAIKSIANGDSANTSSFSMENHWGTHIDAPAHFFPNARSICDFPPDEWVFPHPQVLEISVQENELIGIESLEGAMDARTDILLIRTGFERYRDSVPYSCHNPGIQADVGLWLREKYPLLRAIGFDFISLSAYQKREEGRAAHRAFLDPDGPGKPILIIEDMHLAGDLDNISCVYAIPLMIKGIDSAPCTVLGAFT